MKIYFDGCSNTHGNYLSLVNGHTVGTSYKNLRWTKILSEKLDAQEFNYSMSGGSNNRILRNISREYYHELQNYDLVIIQMTFPHRFEWYDGESKKFKGIGLHKFRMMSDDKKKFDSFHSLWKSFYDKGMYSDECGEATEEICFNTVRCICESKNIPLILLSCNQKTKLQFDYMMKKSHPTKEEQNQLSEDIYQIYTKL